MSKIETLNDLTDTEKQIITKYRRADQRTRETVNFMIQYTINLLCENDAKGFRKDRTQIIDIASKRQPKDDQ